MFISIRKRNGTVVPFAPEKITAAIRKAGEATGEFGEETSRRLMLEAMIERFGAAGQSWTTADGSAAPVMAS